MTTSNWAKFSFSWMNTPVSKARKGTLTVDDLHFPDEFTTDALYDAFDQRWNEEMQKEKSSGKQPSLLSALMSIYGRAYFVAGIMKLLWGAFVICGAFFFVRSLLLYANPKDRNHDFLHDWHGWVLTGCFFLDAILLGLALQRMGYLCVVTGVQVRTVLSNALCRKAFAMAHIHADEAADVVNFMAADLTKVYNGLQEFHYLWTAPFEAATILALLASLTLQYATPGIAVLLIVLPLQYVFGWMIAKHKYANADNTTKRGAIIQEVLPAMKLVKYYCWERFFEDKITAIRRKEEKVAFKVAIIKVINVAMVFAVPPTTAFVIFVSYEFSYKRLVASVAFTTLSLFNILRFPLVVLPKALRAASEGYTSLKRIEKFLIKPVETKQKASGAPGIRVDRAVFTHGKDSHSGFKVRVPKFECRPGEVVAIVGRVGAGKSSLLSALLGNLEVLEGSYQLGGRTAYVPQTAWVQNSSLRDNILFGLPVDEQHYRDVIHACALEMDLEILPLGDGTFGGLRGINLSGGQRQRLNLARAAYFNAETVLLDNALSAVDHHTAEHIFDNLIKGMFADKAVVLVTHQLNFLSRCDKVCVMDHGDVHYFGPWNADAAAMLSKYLPVNTAMSGEHPDDKKPKAKAKAAGPRQEQKKAALPVTKNTLVRGMGAYMVQAGLWLFPFVLCFFLAAQTSRQMSDYWIRQWVDDKLNIYPKKTPTKDQHGGNASLVYTQVYMGLTLGFIILMVFRGSSFFWWSLRCAQGFQKKMLRRVLNTPMSFLLVKPIGDLLISFTQDQDMLDENLPDALHYAGIYGLILLATAVTVSVAINMFAIFAPGTLVVVTGIALYLYLPASTILKKFRGETQSATVGLVTEVLDGLPVIQAFNHEAHFVQEAAKRIDANHRVLFSVESLNLWLAFYLDFYGACLVLAVCAFSVSMRVELGSAVVGLAFSNTIQMLVFYTWSVRLITEAISLWASVEKISWLANWTPIDGKDDVNNDGTDVKTKVSSQELALLREDDPEEEKLQWPTQGVIAFEDVKMRYRPGANLALNGVTFRVLPSEKVGVVGRTGSGKSTLLLALYRMFELAGGRVVVDGLDICSLSLRKLRRGLSIIPQEPVVFTGTVRENLDPYNEYPDADLWRVLRDTGLDGEAKDAGGLTGHLEPSSWSLGQMQLMCLARAALRKVPILCCDEATAAMDPHTEALVIKTIDRLFADRTILTIAHRLDVVIGADKVLVMEQGKVAEMDEPHTLLSDSSSWFSKLVDRGGAEGAAALRRLAAEHARRVRS